MTEINDLTLFTSFSESLQQDKIKFIKSLEKLTDSRNYYTELKQSVSNLIAICKESLDPEERVKKKTKIIKTEVWGKILRSALIFLREQDDRDTGIYREDFGIGLSISILASFAWDKKMMQSSLMTMFLSSPFMLSILYLF